MTDEERRQIEAASHKAMVAVHNQNMTAVGRWLGDIKRIAGEGPVEPDRVLRQNLAMWVLATYYTWLNQQGAKP